MTKRDGDLMDKMTKLEQDEKCRRKSPSRPEGGRDLLDYNDVHSPGKNSTGRQSSSGSFSEFSASSFRDSPRSAPSSLPGSRCGSTPGSRLASRSNSQESIIDLFDSMTLQFGQQLSEGPGQAIQLFSPKPRPLRQFKWNWQDRVRVNHAIWRSWHMQYVKGKKPIICQFSAPTPDARQRLQADVIQGRPINKQWNPSQISSAIRDYNKWRMFGRELFMGEGSMRSSRSPEDNAINLDVPHPPLSPMSAQKLINDDMLKDFSDTLFISTEKKNFTVPAPKKITRHVYNSDIIQPGLMQLEPDFDQDFMETLDSLQDILSKTPTKTDADSLGMGYNLPPNFLADTSLGALSEDMEIVDPSKTTTAHNTYPIAIISNMSGKPVMNQRSVTFAPAPASVVTTQFDPMISSTALSFSSSNQLFPANNLTNQVAAHHTPTMSGAQGGMQHQQHVPNVNQSPTLLQALSKNANNSGSSRHSPHSPQRSLPMTTTSFQPQVVTGPMTSTVSGHNNQGYTVVYSKIESQSPTPTSPPACLQGVAMPPHSSAMGVISEAIDLLSCQIPPSPSKLIPDWQQGQFSGQRSQTWTPTCSMANNLDLSGQLKTSGTGLPFLSYNQIQSELRSSMDPMAPMDQGTVLGQGAYRGEMSPGHQQQRQQQQQPPQQMGLDMRVMEGTLPQAQAQDEAMEYEQYPTVAMGIGASGITVYKQPKREPLYSNSQSNSRSNSKANSRANSRPGSRGNSRASSRASSPRTCFAGMASQPYQDPLQSLQAAQAVLQGKSDGKDVGLRSPSTDRDLAISVPSSCHASTASSAASSPSSQIDYPDTPSSIRDPAFEFHAPRPKRQKTPESASKETKEKETRRRIKHLHSEHKRRFHIQSGLDELQGMIPGMSNGGGDSSSKISTATMLQKAHEYILHLKEENSTLRADVEKAREEIQQVNNEICECQDSLPDTGAPVNSQSEKHLQEMCNDYINKQMQDNWKFWIFSMLARPLFASYVTAVCASPGASFDEEVLEWVEESCRLKPLRKLVYSIVRQISTRTSVLQNPVQLPEEVKEIIREEISKPKTEQS